MADETMTDEQILEGVEHKSFVATSDRTAASLSASGVAAEDVARAAAQAAYDKKGEDVQVLDLAELSDVCDYFVIATGTNNRQVDSIVDEIEEKVASTDTFTPDSVPSDAVAAPETSTSGKLVLVMGTSPDYPPYEFFADAAKIGRAHV